MNDLLFTALTIATLYYFFYYLPEQKKLSTNKQSFSESKAVQTEPLSDEQEKELAPILDELIKQIKQLNHAIK